MEDSKVETDNARGPQMERNAEDGLHKEVGGEGISSLGVLLPASPLVAPILVRPAGPPTLKFIPFLS